MPLTNSQALIVELEKMGITDTRVLSAISKVPRQAFVPKDLQAWAYCNQPLAIGCEQTISQPYVVAKMTELLLANSKVSKVLEIGTGSGYQAAILSRLITKVYSIERIKHLLDQANKRFTQLQYDNISTLHSDGAQGWAKESPFDGIIITAAVKTIPKTLLAQLEDGGCLITPVGQTREVQQLTLVKRQQEKFEITYLDPVIFVPLQPGII